MARVDQRSALHVLNRTRLDELVYYFDLEVSSRAKKDELVDALARSRRARNRVPASCKRVPARLVHQVDPLMRQQFTQLS
jgi:hypothetical protein